MSAVALACNGGYRWGRGSEVRLSHESFGTYSQTSGLVVESVNLCRVDDCTLWTRLALVVGV